MRARYHIKNRWKLTTIYLWGIPVFLVIISCPLIASTQRQIDYVEWYQHLFAGIAGIIVAFMLSQLPVDRLRQILSPLYLLTIISLIAVKFIGSSALGAQRWLSVGNVNIQPSEIAKITTIIILARVLERQKIDHPSKLIKPIGIILIPWFLVFIQPDLGTSLVFGAVLLVMLFWAGMPIEWLILVLSVVVTSIISGTIPWALTVWIPLMGFLAYRSLPRKKIITFIALILQSAIALCTPWIWMNVLKDYQRDRLVLFLDPGKDPLGGGYHLIQSKISIGSGGLLGSGLLNGQLTKLRFIPEQHTDFIFSALGEETGFLGTLVVITAFLILILTLLKISTNARSSFESLIVIGIATMLLFQVIVNIFMNIGLGPVTGIPLPFMSYGRTALLVNFICIGLCLSIAKRGQLMHRSW